MRSALLAGAAFAAFSMGTASTAAWDGYSRTVVEHQTAVVRPAVVEKRTVVRRTIVRRPTIIERKTIVEHPTVVERHTIVKQPIIERRIVEAPPIADRRTVVVRQPVAVDDFAPPVIEPEPPPVAFDFDD